MNRTLVTPLALLAFIALCGSTCTNPCHNEKEYITVEFYNSLDSTQIALQNVPYDSVVELSSGLPMPRQSWNSPFYHDDYGYYQPAAYLIFLDPDQSELSFGFYGANQSDTLQISYRTETAYQDRDCQGMVFKFGDLEVVQHDFPDLQLLPPDLPFQSSRNEINNIRIWL